jgi:hypothetical protein
METTKTWTRGQIETLFATNDEFVKRSVVKLFEYQTSDEQRTEQTIHHNRVGVRPNDAFVLSQLATFAITKGFLSPKQTNWARRRFKKYVGQLHRIANHKQ